MFFGGDLEQWLGLFQYCIIVLVLGIGVGGVSCILTNKTLDKEKKNNFKTKKIKKKGYFLDMA